MSEVSAVLEQVALIQLSNNIGLMQLHTIVHPKYRGAISILEVKCDGYKADKIVFHLKFQCITTK